MELTVTSNAGDRSVEVSEQVFARDFNEDLVHQVVVAHLAGARAGTRAQKSRSQVRGGGAKPWRQKGTGRARAGTIRSPLWRSGGKTFAAVPQDYSQKVNKKMRRAAMRSIVSELVRQDRLLVVDELSLEAPKTKLLVGRLADLGVSNALLLSEQYDERLHLASRNIPNVEAREVSKVDPVSLVAHDKVVMTEAALKKLEEMLA